MNWKEKFLSATIYSIKFKLIAAVVVVQLFSSYIGQLVNLGISKGRASLEKIGFGTSFFDGTVGVVITTMISLVISVFIIVFIYDSLVLKRKNIVEAVSICEDTPGPIAQIVKVAILNHNKPKEEIKKRIKRSPDFSDALANTFYPQKVIIPLDVEKLLQDVL